LIPNAFRDIWRLKNDEQRLSVTFPLRVGIKMANRNLEQDNLFKEIDEDLRQQKYSDLWKKYGKIIIGALVSMVLVVASIKIWESYDLNRRSMNSNSLSSALNSIEKDKHKDAIAVLDDLIKNGGAGYSVLAQFNQAAVFLKKGEKKNAMTAYNSISENNNIEKNFRDIALIMAAQIGLEQGVPSVYQKKLSTLIEAGNAWRHSAKELSALFAQKSGDKTKANNLYKELSDDITAPSGIRSRAAEMAAILSNQN